MTRELALLARITHARFIVSAARLGMLLKANFNPNQPRVPRGNPDGGQWTGGGGSKPFAPRGMARIAAPSGERSPSRIRIPGVTDHGTHLRLDDDGPTIPKQKPVTIQRANRIGWETAKWLLRAAVRTSPIGRVADLISAAGWLYAHRGDIEAYLEGPKTLDELRAAANEPKRGYERHHTVEQTLARQDGFPEELIEGYENTVLIPRYRHWEVTGWFMTHNEDFGLRAPRDFLHGLNWDDRMNMGLRALRNVKVLRP